MFDLSVLNNTVSPDTTYAEHRSCVKVEVDVLIVHTVSVDVEQELKKGRRGIVIHRRKGEERSAGITDRVRQGPRSSPSH